MHKCRWCLRPGLKKGEVSGGTIWNPLIQSDESKEEEGSASSFDGQGNFTATIKIEVLNATSGQYELLSEESFEFIDQNAGAGGGGQQQVGPGG